MTSIAQERQQAGSSDAPPAEARGIRDKTKCNCAEATRLRPAGFAVVASRNPCPCFACSILAKASEFIQIRMKFTPRKGIVRSQTSISKRKSRT
jgi:hypothetical protein